VQLEIITTWTGAHADALRQALRMTKESFAEHLQVAPRTVAYWRERPDMTPLAAQQEALDAALERASDRAKAQFALLVAEMHANAKPSPDGTDVTSGVPLDSMTTHEWTRDDARLLTVSFDAALTEWATDDIERLAHVWLISEPPQTIELRSGRHISGSLISAVEHRVIQLRRADDFVTGPASHELVKRELEATSELLREASLTEEQARRLLTATGELAQLGAWVAADAGLLNEARHYVRGGVLAARAAGNAPLAANIISTYSYQVANTANPNDAVVLARTAYQGGQREATPVTRALLLERVAWASARSGDLRSSERSLGSVEESFSSGPRDNDPDWVYWLNREEIDVMAGRCYTELHQPAKAEALLRKALGQYDQALVRENALYLSWLAEDYVQLGDIDQASDIATSMAALTSHTNSARTDTRLRHVAKQLAPYRNASAAKEFFDAYESPETES
jgi:tetratricopeptide (TPR) repeat protein